MPDQCRKQMIDALHRGIQDGIREGSREELVFGDSLEGLADDAASEIVRSIRFLELLLKAVSARSARSDDQILSYIRRALDGVSDAMSKSAYQLGRYYGNPSREGKRASQGPSASRVLDQWIKQRSEP